MAAALARSRGVMPLARWLVARRAPVVALMLAPHDVLAAVVWGTQLWV